MDLKAGDVFCTANPMWLGRAINAVQRFWDVDNRSKYSHAGIILNPGGETFEALWTITRQNIGAYEHDIIIGRHAQMSPERFDRGFRAVSGYENNRYPFHRLLLHLIPPMGKYISTGNYMVCSELVARFLQGAKLMDFYKGVTPGYLADMIQRWDDWSVVNE